MLNDNQLVWRCRRGVRELDVLFTRFLKSGYPQLSNKEKQTFQRLLEVQDPVIMDWLFGRAEPDDDDLHELIKCLQSMTGIKSAVP